MRKVCGDFGVELREFNGEEDHVHLLVEYPPKMAVSALVNSLKGAPARRLRSQFTGRVNRHIMHGHSWSPSYVAASCGGAPLSIIRQNAACTTRAVSSGTPSSDRGSSDISPLPFRRRPARSGTSTMKICPEDGFPTES